MSGKISITGKGKASAKPDLVVLTMSMETKDADYDKAMKKAAERINELNKSLAAAGFEKDDLKTTNFNVKTDYDTVKDLRGNYRRKFDAYVINHNFKLSFDFSMKRLSKALYAISRCLSNPELSIKFTVKDKKALKDELLRSAAENARHEAEILCSASGAKLGKLLSINYIRDEINIYSHTRYDVEDNLCLSDCCAAPTSRMDIEPENIDVEDNVSFVWEID